MNIRIGNYCLKTLCECRSFDKLSVNIKEDKLPPFHKGCDCVIETNKTVKVKLTDKVECLHCHWTWRPKKESEDDPNYAEVKICPRCKRSNWNIPKEKQ